MTKFKTIISRNGSNNKLTFHMNILNDILNNNQYKDSEIILFCEMNDGNGKNVLYSNLGFLKRDKLDKKPDDLIYEGVIPSKPTDLAKSPNGSLSISEEPIILKANYAVFLLFLDGISQINDPLVTIAAHISHFTIINIELLALTTEIELFNAFLSYGSSISKNSSLKPFQRLEFVVWKPQKIIDKIDGRMEDAGRRYVQKFIDIRDNFRYYAEEYIGNLHYSLMPKFEVEDTLKVNHTLLNFLKNISSIEVLSDLVLNGRCLFGRMMVSEFNNIVGKFTSDIFKSYCKNYEIYRVAKIVDLLPDYYLLYHREMTSTIYPKATSLKVDEFQKLTNQINEKIELKLSKDLKGDKDTFTSIVPIVKEELNIWNRRFANTNEENKKKLTGTITIIILIFCWFGLLIPANILSLFPHFPSFVYILAVLPSQLFLVFILTYMCFNSFDIPAVTKPVDDFIFFCVKTFLFPILWKLFMNISADLLTLLNNEKWSMLKKVLMKIRTGGPNWFLHMLSNFNALL